MRIIMITGNSNTTTVSSTKGIIIIIPTHTAIPMNTGTTVDTIIEIDIIKTDAINTGGITGDRIRTIATRDLTEIVTPGNGSDTIIDTDKK